MTDFIHQFKKFIITTNNNLSVSGAGFNLYTPSNWTQEMTICSKKDVESLRSTVVNKREKEND